MLSSLSPSRDTGYFGNKKTLVTYLLSVTVFWIHISTFYNYGPYPPFPGFLIAFFQLILSRGAIPLFFLISGALFFRNYSPAVYGRKLKSRVKSLLVPYVCWNILMMAFLAVVTLFFSRFFIGRQPFDFSARGILAGLFHWKYNSPFWFVFALMLFALCAPVFYPLLKKLPVGLALLGLLWVLSHWEPLLPEESLLHDRTAVVYYLAGGLIGIHGWERFSSPSPKALRPWAAVCTVLCWGFFTGTVYGWYDPDPMLIPAFRMLYALSLWVLADALCTRVRARVFMEHSFWVYAMHVNVGAVITKLLTLLLPGHWAMAFVNFLLTTVLTLAVIELTCVLLSRFTPKVYRVLSGCR